MEKIYLDYASTTPVIPEVFEAMAPFFSHSFGNTMSVHSFGHDAQQAVDTAREAVASFLACSSSEIVFTSGATESNNLAIKGVVESWERRHMGKLPHIIVSAVEHHSVLDVARALERSGRIQLTIMPVSRDGLVSAKDIVSEIRDNTALISLMYANNEIGPIQPVAELGNIIRNRKRSPYPLLHTDATQAANYLDCSVQTLGVDLLSLSAHKIYGPKGVGALFVRGNTPINRIQDGGDQEYRLRAGTLNVPGIVGLGEATHIARREMNSIESVKNLRDRLLKKVLEEIPGSHLNGSQRHRLPNNVNVRFDNVEGESLLIALDLEGIAVSTGSACSSGALDPSHVLLAIGLKHEEAHGSIRFTLGRFTRKEDIDRTVDTLKTIIARLRSISGSVLEDYHKTH